MVFSFSGNHIKVLEKIGVAFLLAIFFVLTAYLSFGAPLRFNSPDETANFYFASVFARTSQLSVTQNLDLLTPIVHPRSVSVIGNRQVPGSFIGLILFYGSLAKITGPWAMPFFTPIITTIALAAFYFLVRNFFGRKTALVSALLWVVNPAILYYTARGLLPNMLFISLTIFSLFFINRAAAKKNQASFDFINWVFAGLFLGAALAVRPSEVLWLLPLIIVILALNKTRWNRLAIFSAAFLIVIAITGYYQNQTFGAPWRFGYTQFNQISSVSAAAVTAAAPVTPNTGRPVNFASQTISILGSYLLPFGFNLKAIARNSFDYLVWIFWWLFLPAIWALISFIRSLKAPREKTQKYHRLYFYAGLVISLWLIIYYGSGQFIDSTLPGATIGTSYVRYWLPIYVWAIPLISEVLKKSWRSRAVIFGFPAMAYLGLGLAFWLTPESLIQVKTNIIQYESENQRIQQLTEPDAVIITSRTDKIFFPQRQVIHYLDQDYSFKDGVAAILPQAPVYFFTLLSQTDVNYLNATEFQASGWKLIPDTKIDNFLLQKAVLIKS